MNSPAVACHHAATEDVATAIVVVVVVRAGIVSVVVGSKAKPCKRASVKSAVKSSVKSSTVEPTASEASMKATAVEAAFAKAAAVTTAAAGRRHTAAEPGPGRTPLLRSACLPHGRKKLGRLSVLRRVKRNCVRSSIAAASPVYAER